MDERQFFVVQPSDRRRSDPAIPGTTRWVICDEETDAVNMVAGIVEVAACGDAIPSHYHLAVDELQFVVSGSGVVRDSEGNEHPVTPGTAIYCGAGSPHEFENTGDAPLIVLFVYPSPGGMAPDVTWSHD